MNQFERGHTEIIAESALFPLSSENPIRLFGEIQFDGTEQTITHAYNRIKECIKDSHTTTYLLLGNPVNPAQYSGNDTVIPVHQLHIRPAGIFRIGIKKGQIHAAALTRETFTISNVIRTSAKHDMRTYIIQSTQEVIRKYFTQQEQETAPKGRPKKIENSAFAYLGVPLTELTAQDRRSAYKRAGLTGKEMKVLNLVLGIATGHPMKYRDIARQFHIPRGSITFHLDSAIAKLKGVKNHEIGDYTEIRKKARTHVKHTPHKLKPVEYVAAGGKNLQLLSSPELETLTSHLEIRQKSILLKAIGGTDLRELAKTYETNVSNIKWTIKQAMYRLDHPSRERDIRVNKQEFSVAGSVLSDMDGDRRRHIYSVLKFTPLQIRILELRLGIEDGIEHKLIEIQHILKKSDQTRISAVLKVVSKKLKTLA